MTALDALAAAVALLREMPVKHPDQAERRREVLAMAEAAMKEKGR